MMKSLSLSMLFLGLRLTQGSRSEESPAVEAPLSGAQMIQVKSEGYKLTYSNAKKTCHQNEILTRHAPGPTNRRECQQACKEWPLVQPQHKNRHKSCGAGYFFHQADGSPSCRLFVACKTCERVGIAGETFTSSATSCKAPCARSDCDEKHGWTLKQGWEKKMCSSSKCSLEECCNKR
jgi:hypothetical protein